jgi:hypothetical protein
MRRSTTKTEHRRKAYRLTDLVGHVNGLVAVVIVAVGLAFLAGL